VSDRNELVVSGAMPPVVFTIQPQALQLRDDALAGSALIGKVETSAQNELAVRAHIELKRIASTFEKARKALKEPILQAGRDLDRAVNAELIEVEKEIGRLSNLTTQFNQAEQRRVREEQEMQRRELERIEREKQEAIARIAKDQAEAERKALEAVAAVRKIIDSSTSQEVQAEAKAAITAAEAEGAKMIAEAASKAISATQQVTERAQQAAAVEAKPIIATRAAGQVVKTDWEIQVTNPYELAKFHPDCVTIEPKLGQIKAHLAAGITVKGITAKQVTKSTVRAGTVSAIDV
jgi:hypothetical protein